MANRKAANRNRKSGVIRPAPPGPANLAGPGTTTPPGPSGVARHGTVPVRPVPRAVPAPPPRKKRDGPQPVPPAPVPVVPPGDVTTLTLPALRQSPAGRSAQRDAELASDDYIARCVRRLAAGMTVDVQDAFQDLFVHHGTDLTGPALLAARQKWLKALLTCPNLRQRAAENPELFAGAIKWCRLLATGAGDPRTEPTAQWLKSRLTALGQVPGVAEILLKENWDNPDFLSYDVIDWIVTSLGTDGLNKPGAGLSALAINLLWQAGKYHRISALVAAGVDTTSASDVGCLNRAIQKLEGVHSGFVQPLEHLIAKYVGVLGSPEQSAALPKEKRDGLRLILGALDKRGDTMILTDYDAVRKSDLVTACDKVPGTIWGFEHVRQPYVQAVHNTTFGQQPVRMMEIWDVVNQILFQTTYEGLLHDPANEIPRIVDAAVAKLNVTKYGLPCDYAGRPTAEFEKNFRQQATTYLEYLATAPPTAKFLTAGRRGFDEDKYMAAFGCRAGLWWSERIGRPVYYILDGIKMADVANFKKVKTKAINTFLDAQKPDPYNEVVTLIEIREILKNWKDLKGVVQFVHKGRFLTQSELDDLLGWVGAIEDTDAEADVRKAPPRQVFQKEIDRLDPALSQGLTDAQVMKVVAAAELVRMATVATDAKPDMLATCLKGNQVLFDHGYIPLSFYSDYVTMIGLSDAKARAEFAEQMKSTYKDRICDYLRVPLLDAIDRYSKPVR